MDLTPYALPVLTVFGSFVGAWLAARFALRRFYDEKLWERKTVAYTAIFEALYDISVWFDAHLSIIEDNTKIDEAARKKLYADFLEAKRRLSRRIAAEVWLLPDEFVARLRELTKRLEHEPGQDWYYFLDQTAGAIDNTIEDLTKLVRTDLLFKM